jgi:hypothetical protein
MKFKGKCLAFLIQRGMSKEEVAQILGTPEPDEIFSVGIAVGNHQLYTDYGIHVSYDLKFHVADVEADAPMAR